MSALPQTPAQAHTRPPPDAFSYVEANPDQDFSGKTSLTTTSGVKREWRTGSKKRVIKYYLVNLAIGLLVGGIIGMIIGLAIRYS